MGTVALELYPERRLARSDAVDRVVVAVQAWAVQGLGGWRWHRTRGIVQRVRALDGTVAKMSTPALRAEARALHRALRSSDCAEDGAVARCFALVREAALRILGMRHHDVQIAGALAMLRSTVAEMGTGEGKTLTATLATATAAIAGWPVHLITVNDYLAERDARAMGPLYEFFGLSVGVVRGGQSPDERRAAYACDITYCTNKEIAFDYLRDRIVLGGRSGELQLRAETLTGRRRCAQRLVLRGLHYAIVDEADSVLIDEARTPLIISRELDTSDDARTYAQAMEVAGALKVDEDFVLRTDERTVALTPSGSDAVASRIGSFGGPWAGAAAREELTVKALTALYVNRRDDHYIVREGKVEIVDEYTGRVMPDRFWSDGIQQMTELKEGVEMSGGRETMARTTYQRFFRRYRRLAGMSGTCREAARELWRVYGLAVTRIPPHKPSRLVIRAPRVLSTARGKWGVVVETVRRLHARGAPVLLGTRSVAASRTAAGQLRKAGLPFVVLSAAQDAHEAEIVAQAGERGRITIATSMCGRGTDIHVGEEVVRLGGLHVIMSERYDAGRIDRQLAGRTGRQGNPGVFLPILSLEDTLIDDADRSGLLRGVARALMPVMGQWVGHLVLGFAQRKAERLHARMRRDLLARDEMLERTLAFSGRMD